MIPEAPRITKRRVYELAAEEAGLPIKAAGRPDFYGVCGYVAELLGYTRQAVHVWPDVVPPLAAYKLRDIRPQWFEDAKP